MVNYTLLPTVALTGALNTLVTPSLGRLVMTDEWEAVMSDERRDYQRRLWVCLLGNAGNTAKTVY